MDIKSTLTTILKDSLILVFNEDKLDIVKTAESLIKAGINNMEVTCRIKKPLEKMKRLRKELPDFAAGAASMIDFAGMLKIYNKANAGDPLPTVDEVVEAGVSYVVSAANFSDATYKKYAGKIPIIPGCGTVSEILDQFSKGANFCKVFPAKELGGPEFVKAVDPAIHKTISLIPTGGTNAGNIPTYVDAGILALGGSFSIIDKAVMKKIIDEQNYGLLADEFKKIKQLIDTARAAKWPSIDFTKATVEQISQVTKRNFNLRS
jgi:2-dehydro-3-deoxyphosphogluconate aldolase/(4S)-4-hydroxy-2-oxoglutarate aldolase